MTTILSIDFDKHAAATYKANFPDVDVRCATVESVDLPYADIICGGPPCQSFSTAGDGLGDKDARNGWPAFVAKIANGQPRMFLGENVPGMLTEKHIGYFGRILSALEEAGYVVQWRVQDAVEFGVPQFRNRVWIWGIRRDLYVDGIRHKWPRATHQWPPQQGETLFGASLLPGVTVGQALNLNSTQRVMGGGRNHTEKTPDGKWRRDERDITLEPSTTIAGFGGALVGGSHPRIIGSCRDIRVAAGEKPRFSEGPNERFDSPHFTVDGKPYAGAIYDHGVCIADEPSPTLKAGGNVDASGKQGGGCPPVIEYRWSDKMLLKHPPASPAPTVQAKWFKRLAEGLLAIDTEQKRTLRAVTEPCPTVAGDSRHHLKHDGVFVRRLTPAECMRLQSAPDEFVWPEKITKTAMHRIAGNGWACAHSAAFSRAFKLADPDSETVIDLFCGGGLGACGWHGRYWELPLNTQPRDGGKDDR